jgi:DNA-binding response OmpR family regulator
VDDDPAALSILCEIVEEAGWEPHGFERLGALRDALESQPPDLVILDDDLPDGRGGDLARALRQDPTTRDLPVVVCTAAHPARRSQIDRWASVVAKPFHIEELESCLLRTVRARTRIPQRAAG